MKRKAGSTSSVPATDGPGPAGSFREVPSVSTRSGLTSFGGQLAHLVCLRTEIIERRKRIDEASA